MGVSIEEKLNFLCMLRRVVATTIHHKNKMPSSPHHRTFKNNQFLFYVLNRNNTHKNIISNVLQFFFFCNSEMSPNQFNCKTLCLCAVEFALIKYFIIIKTNLFVVHIFFRFIWYFVVVENHLKNQWCLVNHRVLNLFVGLRLER